MVSAKNVVYYAFHPAELRSMVQWKVWHDPVHARDKDGEPASVAKCYYYLDKTSRSFSFVIQELHPELKLVVALYYLILRGLDTIEDDMTIPLNKKLPLLRDFDTILEKNDWSFTGNGPDERDRELLVNFGVVIEEYKKIKPAYKVIINGTTKKMGDGMAKYAIFAEEHKYVETLLDYDEYCFFVAGILGEGLTRLFVEAKLGNPLLLERPYLHKSMGLFLQKTNILRDVREDFDDDKRWWPTEIWSKHVDNFQDLFKPENKQKALQCSSEMVLNALGHTEECLFYLLGLKEQSVFNFCAIPQSMAIATLELCFQNYTIFQRNIKITRGQACQLMIESTQDQRKLFEIFRRHTRSILKKNDPKDPNYLKISMACARIEKFIMTMFPENDPKPEAKSEVDSTVSVDDAKVLQKAASREAQLDTVYMAFSVASILIFMSLTMISIAYLLGARFDVMIDELAQSIYNPFRTHDATATVIRKYDHGEL